MASIQTAINDLRQVVGDAGILTDRDELLVYECDGLSVARGRPSAVVFPTSTEQVVACVRVLAKHNLPMVPRGSGTGLTGGSVAFVQDVLISTARMTRIESIDLENRMAVVQAGVLNTALSDAVARAAAAARADSGTTLAPGGLHFSPAPSSQHASTIGGNAATNAGGVNTLKYGVTSSHILGMEMVLPDGEILTTRAGALRDGIGPDLPGLLCGSEGTLGIITRLWCRLSPRPQHFRTVYAVFSSTPSACQAVSDVIAAGIVPAAMEMMDGQMIRVVEQAFGYGFPDEAQALLLIEIDGVEHLLDDELNEIVAICERNGAQEVRHCSDPVRREELWQVRRRTFGAIGRLHTAYFTQDACVPRSKLAEVVAHIVEMGKQADLTINNVFHAGDGNIHPIFFFDDDDPDQITHAMRVSEKVLEYCVAMGGTISGEHGIGVEKIALMPVMFNPATIDTFQRIKNAFDPRHRINDGKLVPSDTLRIELLTHH